MNFYCYSENNSGGVFAGKYSTIYIEADSSSDADYIAESYDVYFDGCEKGRDCSCCGDRWSRAYGSGDGPPEAAGVPLEKGDSLDDVIAKIKSAIEENPQLFLYIHSTKVVYADGTIDTYDFTDEIIEDLHSVKESSKESFWGFTWYETWDKPTKVDQYFQSDWDSTEYYDKEGNRSIQRLADEDLGWFKYEMEYVDGFFYGFTSLDKTEVEAARSAYVKKLAVYKRLMRKVRKEYSEMLEREAVTAEDKAIAESLSGTIQALKM